VRNPPTPEMRQAAKAGKTAIRHARAASYASILAQVMVDLGTGPSVEAKRQLAQRFALLCCAAADAERKYLSQGRLDVRKHTELVCAMMRLASRLGLNPPKGQAADTPSLASYLDQKDEPADETGTGGPDFASGDRPGSPRPPPEILVARRVRVARRLPRNAKGHTLRAGTVGGVRLFVGFPDDRGLIFI
jgi:hypothetical protein